MAKNKARGAKDDKVIERETLSEDIVDKLAGTILRQVGTMINVRLAVIEQRLPPEPSIRPQLGKTKKLPEKSQAELKEAAKLAETKTATYAEVTATKNRS